MACGAVLIFYENILFGVMWEDKHCLHGNDNCLFWESEDNNLSHKYEFYVCKTDV